MSYNPNTFVYNRPAAHGPKQQSRAARDQIVQIKSLPVAKLKKGVDEESPRLETRLSKEAMRSVYEIKSRRRTKEVDANLLTMSNDQELAMSEQKTLNKNQAPIEESFLLNPQDKLFDFMMQSDGLSCSLQDAEVVDFIEEKSIRSRIREEARRGKARRSPATMEFNRERGRLKPGNEVEPLTKSSLYVNTFFDFNKANYVEPIQSEVRRQEEALMKAPGASAERMALDL